MTNSPERPVGTAAAEVKRPRHRRQAYVPKWLRRPGEQQQIARARCLMILSVLSGQRSVGEAIVAGKIPRPLYYQLERRALEGMLRALDPMTSATLSEHRELTEARAKVRALSAQVKDLTQCKRSAERLLRLVLKSNHTPLKVTRRGRPPKALSMRMPAGADSP